jgi:hypothetical protein
MEKSPVFIELYAPANLKIRELSRRASPKTLFANTTVAPEKYEAEKEKWLKTIRIKKFYRIFTMIDNATTNRNCDNEGFVYFQSTELEKVLGSAYARTCRIILENIGVVQTHFKRKLGFCGLWLRFTDQYQNQPQIRAVFKHKE